MAATEDGSRTYYSPEVDRTQEGLQVDPRKHEPDPYYLNAKAPTRQTQYLNGSPASNRKGPSWLIFGVAIAVVAAVVGGAIGGGLGSSLAKCKNDLRDSSLSITPISCNATISPLDQSTSVIATANATVGVSGQLTYATTTSGLILNYVAEPTGRVYNIATDCESIPDGQIRPPSSGVFGIYCNKDIAWGGVAKQKGPNNETLTIIDIVGSISYSLTDCVQSCAVFNSKAQSFGREDRCRSITFESKLNDAFESQQANCWLKNGSVSSPDNMMDSEGSISAVLVQGYGEGGIG